MTLCANGAADLACGKWACGGDGRWYDTRTLHSFDRNVMLGAMPTVTANKDTGVLTASVFAAINDPLLLQLTLGAWAIWPFKLFHHLVNMPNVQIEGLRAFAQPLSNAGLGIICHLSQSCANDKENVGLIDRLFLP